MDSAKPCTVWNLINTYTPIDWLYFKLLYSFKLANETLRGLAVLPDIEWFILVCLWSGVIFGDKKIIPSKGINLFWCKLNILQDNQEVQYIDYRQRENLFSYEGQNTDIREGVYILLSHETVLIPNYIFLFFCNIWLKEHILARVNTSSWDWIFCLCLWRRYIAKYFNLGFFKI